MNVERPVVVPQVAFHALKKACSIYEYEAELREAILSHMRFYIFIKITTKSSIKIYEPVINVAV